MSECFSVFLSKSFFCVQIGDKVLALSHGGGAASRPWSASYSRCEQLTPTTAAEVSVAATTWPSFPLVSCCDHSCCCVWQIEGLKR